MRRILLSVVLVLASCASAGVELADIESVADELEEVNTAVAEDSAPTVDEPPARDVSRGLDCRGRQESSMIFDFAVPTEPASGDNSALEVVTQFMSTENPSWLQRRDWQRLSLEPEMSTNTSFAYVDEDGSVYLRINTQQLSGTWVISGLLSCAPEREELATFDDDFVPIPNSEGHLPFNQRLECGGSLLSMEFVVWLPLAEGRDFQRMRDAIMPFLEGGEGQQWPQDVEWRVAHADADHSDAPQATLVARDGDNFSWMSVALNDGEWRWTGSSIGGDCELYVVLDDLSTVEWEVIDSSPDSSMVRVRANERSCTGGQDMGDRLREPIVTLTPDTAYVLLTADRLPGARACPGNPSVDVDVDLGEPLGDREIQNTQTSMGWFSAYWPGQ